MTVRRCWRNHASDSAVDRPHAFEINRENRTVAVAMSAGAGCVKSECAGFARRD